MPLLSKETVRDPSVRSNLLRSPYFLSLLLLAFPAAISIVFQPYLKAHPALQPVMSVLYLIGMCTPAWLLGYRGGLLGVFVCLEAASFANSGRFTVTGLLVPGVAAITSIVLVVSWVAASRRRYERLLREANQLLETRVDERTLELARARDWLQTTLASIGDAVIATDSKGNVILMNRVAEALTEWTSGECAGMPLARVFRVVNATTGAEVESPVEKVMASGVTVGLANHTILITRSGLEIPIDDSAAPIRGPGGEIEGIVLIFRDISVRHALEAERERRLREASAARAQLSSVFQQTPAMINLYRGPQHILDVVHPRTKELSGRDIAGLPFCEAFPESADGGFLPILDHVYKTGQPHAVSEHPVRLSRQDGEALDIYFNVHFQPWRDLDGSIAGVISVGTDVTDQVRTRRELAMTEERMREAARLESLGVMAGGIAHDFNNLLVGIIGNASLVREMLSEGDPSIPMLDDLVSAGDRAAKLTRQMLTYAGKEKPEREAVDLSVLVTEILPLIMPAIARHVAITTDLNPNLPRVDGDSGQLQSIVMNLVINASEACGAKPGAVHIATSVAELNEGLSDPGPGLSPLGPTTCIVLTVSDTGSGMTDEVKARIFDPFFTTKFTGRGLGLAATHGVVRAHNGAIKVDSMPGNGTTFRVFLPASSDTVPARESDSPGNRSFVVKGTVLVVDDEDIVLRLATLTLQRHGHNVLAASGGIEALDIFRRRHREIDLVVLDFSMPAMTGNIVLREMREIDPRVRVILTSGFSESQTLEQFDSSVPDSFLHKPFTAGALAEKTRSALDRSSRARGRPA